MLERVLNQGSLVAKDEGGNAILEFAISLFFLGTLTMGVIDFGNVLNDYAAVTEAAHHGARFASGELGLVNNISYSKLTDKQDGCPSTVNTRSGPGNRETDTHEAIQERVDEILDLGSTQLNQDSLCITTTLEDQENNQTTGPNGRVPKNVVVAVQITYRSMLYGDFPISVQARAPYLQQ